MSYPDCPKHGSEGVEAALTARSLVIRFGRTEGDRPRQVFQCRFELKGGGSGVHRFREPIPRLMSAGAICGDCGAPLEDWNGERVPENYWFAARPMAQALCEVGLGVSYREASANLRRAINRLQDPNEGRRTKTATRAATYLSSPDPKQRRKGHQLRARNPIRMFSNAPHELEWLVETFAPALHRELAPQAWPAGGILAVDAIKMNLLGHNKYVDAQGVIQELPDSEETLMRRAVPLGGTIPPAVNPVETEIEDTLDPDDPEEVDALRVFRDLFKSPTLRPGTGGGVPCWQVLAAYGYSPNSKGEFPRDEMIGKPWLFRSYYQPNALSWAHFFRQMPGTPKYILCDMAHEIRVGVELAWPDPTNRPEVLTCEYHASEAIRRRVEGIAELEEEARLVFSSHGRTVLGHYRSHISNGGPGSFMRAWHFWRFRQLANEAERREFERLFRTPTWRRIIAQAIAKDGSLRYSTGALEKVLAELISRRIGSRRHYLRNRNRTDRLLMLIQLSALGMANPESFLGVLEHWLHHHGGTPRQLRQVDPIKTDASLRAPITDAELSAVGLPTHAEFAQFMKKRQRRLHAERVNQRYNTEAEFRRAANTRRTAQRRRNDPDGLAMKVWYAAHKEAERAAGRQRRARARAADPEGERERGRQSSVVSRLAKSVECSTQDSRAALEAANWDRAAAKRLLEAKVTKPI